jgi:glycogen(starch) synthase
MRVLMLSWEYPPHTVGGMGRHVTELSVGLAGRGFDVHVVTPLLHGGAAEESIADRLTVHRVATPPMEGYDFFTFVQHANAALEQAAQALAHAEPFAIVHAHDWLTAGAAIALKHAWRRPLVATMHATERGRQQGHISSGHSDQINTLEWSLTYEAWRVITCSRFMADQVHTYFNTPDDKIDVVPNGVRPQPSPFASCEERAAFRSRFAADGAPLVFFVGRVVYEKGVHVLVQAWPQVAEAQPGARLVIAGTGAELDRARQLARELGVHESIEFGGFISDTEREQFYRAADMAVFPSLYEPFGIVALEAMAAGCPVVAAETGGLAEVVRLHETGITVYPNDPSSLAWGILHTLQHPDWARTRAENALGEVRDIYDWTTIAEATGTIYERTVADWRRKEWGL